MVAPPIMLLIARAATCRLSIGLAGLYGCCRFSDHATCPPTDGLIGSRPCRPVLIDAKSGLLPLVIRENTHKICRVDLPHAKLTWLGSDLTSGFRHAIAICRWTVATPGGQDGPGRTRSSTRTVSRIAPTAAARPIKTTFRPR